jgi:hypothetical protein
MANTIHAWNASSGFGAEGGALVLESLSGHPADAIEIRNVDSIADAQTKINAWIGGMGLSSSDAPTIAGNLFTDGSGDDNVSLEWANGQFAGSNLPLPAWRSTFGVTSINLTRSANLGWLFQTSEQITWGKTQDYQAFDDSDPENVIPGLPAIFTNVGFSNFGVPLGTRLTINTGNTESVPVTLVEGDITAQFAGSGGDWDSLASAVVALAGVGNVQITLSFNADVGDFSSASNSDCTGIFYEADGFDPGDWDPGNITECPGFTLTILNATEGSGDLVSGSGPQGADYNASAASIGASFTAFGVTGLPFGDTADNVTQSANETNRKQWRIPFDSSVDGIDLEIAAFLGTLAGGSVNAVTATVKQEGGGTGYPSEDVVLNNVTYGANDEFVGQYVEAQVSEVRAGVQYGAGGTELTGTCAVPAAANVRFGTAVGATTGTCKVPAAADVRSGINTDVAGVGTIVVPAASNVRFGTSVDTGTGTCRVPAAADVRLGVAVDVSPGAGTCAVPSASRVLSGVSVDASVGTVTQPTANQVLAGVSFGADGNQYTGTLTPRTSELAGASVATRQFFPRPNVFPASFVQGASTTVRARLTNERSSPYTEGAAIVPDDVATIECWVYSGDDVVDGFDGATLVVDDVILSSLEGWSEDEVGHNFRHQLPPGAMPVGNILARVSYRVTYSDGFVQRFEARGPVAEVQGG